MGLFLRLSFIEIWAFVDLSFITLRVPFTSERFCVCVCVCGGGGGVRGVRGGRWGAFS